MTPNCIEPQEVYVACSLWELVRTCGLKTRTDGRPHEGCSNFEFGSAAKCQITVHYLGTYGVLQEVHQKLCPNHHTNGEIVEKGCHILLE